MGCAAWPGCAGSEQAVARARGHSRRSPSRRDRGSATGRARATLPLAEPSRATVLPSEGRCGRGVRAATWTLRRAGRGWPVSGSPAQGLRGSGARCC
eukprot:3414273-Lingulodinium_polyedra.AAC.1